MRWTSLGHAMWLAEIGGLRILFDPLTEPTFQGGVFEVCPRRAVDVAALRPDILVVSHVHPDHFDVPTLARLVRHAPDAVVLTADPLVAAAATTLGFSTVRKLDACEVLEIGDLQLLTTPSWGDAIEWGVLVAHRGAAVWNQIDTVLHGPDNVRSVLDSARQIGVERVELALVQWQPLREIQAQLGYGPGFPVADYAQTLERIAELDACAVVPSSAGFRHVDRYGWLNRYVYPLPEGRLLRELAIRCPRTRAWPGAIGATFHVAPGEVTCDLRGGAALVEVTGTDDRAFAPLHFPPVVDDEPDEGALRAVIEPWIAADLCTALAGTTSLHNRRLALEIVYSSGSDVRTLVPSATTVRSEPGCDDWDVLNVVAASMLADVVTGRRHWGEPLLAGQLRGAVRTWDVTAAGLQPVQIGAFFLYRALTYRRSVERWTVHQLRALGFLG